MKKASPSRNDSNNDDDSSCYDAENLIADIEKQRYNLRYDCSSQQPRPATSTTRSCAAPGNVTSTVPNHHCTSASSSASTATATATGNQARRRRSRQRHSITTPPLSFSGTTTRDSRIHSRDHIIRENEINDDDDDDIDDNELTSILIHQQEQLKQIRGGGCDDLSELDLSLSFSTLCCVSPTMTTTTVNTVGTILTDSQSTALISEPSWSSYGSLSSRSMLNNFNENLASSAPPEIPNRTAVATTTTTTTGHSTSSPSRRRRHSHQYGSVFSPTRGNAMEDCNASIRSNSSATTSSSRRPRNSHSPTCLSSTPSSSPRSPRRATFRPPLSRTFFNTKTNTSHNGNSTRSSISGSANRKSATDVSVASSPGNSNSTTHQPSRRSHRKTRSSTSICSDISVSYGVEITRPPTAINKPQHSTQSLIQLLTGQQL